ncbi:MAG: antA/AntB antirepressor family protein [Lactobacillus sp.]|nr:antA/AntB antirepressor family protein [Lactobacillus sp.]
MKELIPTQTDNKGNILVSGRDLHKFLGSKAQYTNWFERMCGYGFDENVDFTVFNKNVKDDTAFGGYRKITDHAMTLDMAKEISMVQHNEKGKQARRYFIDVEKEYHLQEQKPLNISQQIRLLALGSDQHEKEIQEIKDRIGLPSNLRRQLTHCRNYKIIQILGGKKSSAYMDKKLRSKIYRALFSDFKSYFMVDRYEDVSMRKFDEAVKFTNNWYPSFVLSQEINKANEQGVLEISE